MDEVILYFKWLCVLIFGPIWLYLVLRLSTKAIVKSINERGKKWLQKEQEKKDKDE